MKYEMKMAKRIENGGEKKLINGVKTKKIEASAKWRLRRRRRRKLAGAEKQRQAKWRSGGGA